MSRQNQEKSSEDIFAVIVTIVTLALMTVIVISSCGCEKANPSPKKPLTGFWAIEPNKPVPSPEFREMWGSDSLVAESFIQGSKDSGYELSDKQKLFVEKEVAPRITQIAVQLSNNGELPMDRWLKTCLLAVEKATPEIGKRLIAIE